MIPIFPPSLEFVGIIFCFQSKFNLGKYQIYKMISCLGGLKAIQRIKDLSMLFACVKAITFQRLDRAEGTKEESEGFIYPT
jgi:hypothetical protein